MPRNKSCKFTGKDHPAYVNGSGRGYQYKYVNLSIKLLGNNCQICNTSKNIYTHHKDNNPRNNPLDGSNWQRLCASCHNKLHSKKRVKELPEDRLLDKLELIASLELNPYHFMVT